MSNYFGMLDKQKNFQLPAELVRDLGLGAVQNRIPMSETVELLLLARPGGQQLACVAKHAGSRERALYEFVLADRDSARLLASLKSPTRSGWWLLLEALDQTFPDLSDPAQVSHIYRHLGQFHRRYAQRGGRTLVHGDVHRWNMVWHQNSLRLLDWEQSRYGDPVADLALLEPEEDLSLRSEILPTGRMAELALQAYHRSGPLDSLAWSELIRQQQLIRLIRAGQAARQYEQVAISLPEGEARAVVLDHAMREWQRVKRLQSLCRE